MSKLTLVWQKDLHFKSGADSRPIELESSSPTTMSPMHALAYSVMGCMGMDVVHILQKGRHDLRGLAISFEGERAPEAPKRYTAMHLHFEVTGHVPEDAIARAIQLSREKYCSVMHSLRDDIKFTTTISTLAP